MQELAGGADPDTPEYAFPTLGEYAYAAGIQFPVRREKTLAGRDFRSDRQKESIRLRTVTGAFFFCRPFVTGVKNFDPHDGLTSFAHQT